MKSYSFQVKTETRQFDVLGHLNNAAYMELFEAARWQIYIEKGFGPDWVKTSGFGPVILEASLKYKKEIPPCDKVLIETDCVEYSRLIGIVEQRMYGPQGKVACLGMFKIALMDLRQRKLISPLPEMRQIWD